MTGPSRHELCGWLIDASSIATATQNPNTVYPLSPRNHQSRPDRKHPHDSGQQSERFCTESGQAVSIINAANKCINQFNQRRCPDSGQRQHGRWGMDGGHLKLLQPSPSSHGMRSHAEQRAHIALHAALTSAPEHMRRFAIRASIDENKHQHCRACHCLA